MIIEEFPELVFDELHEDPDVNKLYLISKPTQCHFKIDEDKEFFILTSQPIRRMLCQSIGYSIPYEFVVVAKHFIFDPNDTKDPICITIIDTGSACGSIFFMFWRKNNPKMRILYTGYFNEMTKTLDKQLMSDIKRAKITNIFYDTTLMHNPLCENDLEAACNNIQKIKRQYPNKRLFLELNILECINLIPVLRRKYDGIIFLHEYYVQLLQETHFDTANYNVDADVPFNSIHIRISSIKPLKDRPLPELIAAFKQDIIYVYTSESTYIGDEKVPIFKIGYVQHPSYKLLELMTQKVQPIRLHSIQSDSDAIHESGLMKLCRQPKVSKKNKESSFLATPSLSGATDLSITIATQSQPVMSQPQNLTNISEREESSVSLVALEITVVEVSDTSDEENAQERSIKEEFQPQITRSTLRSATKKPRKESSNYPARNHHRSVEYLDEDNDSYHATSNVSANEQPTSSGNSRKSQTRSTPSILISSRGDETQQNSYNVNEDTEGAIVDQSPPF